MFKHLDRSASVRSLMSTDRHLGACGAVRRTERCLLVTPAEVFVDLSPYSGGGSAKTIDGARECRVQSHIRQEDPAIMRERRRSSVGSPLADMLTGRS